MARLIPIEYFLDEHELPEHRLVTGELDIELDHVDGLPYIWAFDLRVYNDATNHTVEYDYQQGHKSNHIAAVELLKELHRDTKLMDRIYDECAHQGGWD